MKGRRRLTLSTAALTYQRFHHKPFVHLYVGQIISVKHCDVTGFREFAEPNSFWRLLIDHGHWLFDNRAKSKTDGSF